MSHSKEEAINVITIVCVICRCCFLHLLPTFLAEITCPESQMKQCFLE